jgi:putative ABC transport system substrate-binding protein
MRRRDFITLLGAAAPCFGLAADLRGETNRVYRIGVLETIPAAQNAANLAGLLRGLRERGYVEGQNLKIEYRSADGRAERFSDLAAEMARVSVDLIVTRGTGGQGGNRNAPNRHGGDRRTAWRGSRGESGAPGR